MKFELLWIFHVGYHVPDLIHQLTFTSSSNMSEQAPQNCAMYCITVPPAGESVEIHELVLKTVAIDEISLNHLRNTHSPDHVLAKINIMTTKIDK